MNEVPALLSKLQRAYQAVVEAQTTDELKRLPDEAATFVAYVQKRGLAIANNGAKIKATAEWRLGQLVDEQPKASAGQPYQGSICNTMLQADNRIPTFLERGINRMQASRWRVIAQIQKDDLHLLIEDATARHEQLTALGRPAAVSR